MGSPEPNLFISYVLVIHYPRFSLSAILSRNVTLVDSGDLLYSHIDRRDQGTQTLKISAYIPTRACQMAVFWSGEKSGITPNYGSYIATPLLPVFLSVCLSVPWEKKSA